MATKDFCSTKLSLNRTPDIKLAAIDRPRVQGNCTEDIMKRAITISWSHFACLFSSSNVLSIFLTNRLRSWHYTTSEGDGTF